MLKTLVLRLSLAPLDLMAEIGRRFLPAGPSADALPLGEITRASPLVLQIETTNICNARCVFCAYKKLQREKGIMGIPLFEKIIAEYSEMGGGAVSLTPIMGDPLLDKYLPERFRILKENAKITQISLSTNLIALNKFSDEEVAGFLEALAFIQVSIGGLDPATYSSLYGVDCFSQVRQAMSRLLEINKTVSDPADISFAFRTNDWMFERRFRRGIAEFRAQGASVNHIWTYANYGGMVESNQELGLEINRGPLQKTSPCALPSLSMAVCWDGTITACGCADAEGRGLQLGNMEKDRLADVWPGKKRDKILESFRQNTLAKICRECSAYQPDTIFSRLNIKDIMPGKPLPENFYHKFWGA